MSNFYTFIMSNKELIKKILPTKFLKQCKLKVIESKFNRYKADPIDLDTFRQFSPGVNLIGDVKVEIGLGQSARLIANALDLSKLDFGIFDFPIVGDVRRNDHTWEHKIKKDTCFNINLFHINPQDTGTAYLSLGKGIWKNHYNIGFWLWELEEFPEEYLLSLKFVDEIWTPSEFTSNCFRNITDKPVYTIPYYVTADADPKYDRSHFGLPETKFLFLIMFDFNSTMLRKNPAGAIQAFKQAFRPDDQDVGLVIKVNNPTDECMNTLQDLLAGYENVYYITKTLDKPEVNSLIACTDVFVSLHRAEGFGLVMAEAMLLKTACIATNWSSNTEFMNSDTACMVSYTMKQIEEGEGSYPPGATWADPSIEETTMYMQKLKESPDYYRDLVDRAYLHVSDVLGKDRVVHMLESRLSTIYDAILSEDLQKLQIVHPTNAKSTLTHI